MLKKKIVFQPTEDDMIELPPTTTIKKGAVLGDALNTPQQHSRVQTVVTADGSEIPQRLNNKVFVDGFPFNHDEDRLEELFAQFVHDWKVGKLVRLLKKQGQGFGYAAFRSPHSVEGAINVLNGRKFLGRCLRVELPQSEKPLSNRGARNDEMQSSYSRQVLLTDLSKNIATADLIREVLNDVAPVLAQKIEQIKMTGNNRKAFVTLSSVEDVAPMVKFLDGYTFLGRKICAVAAAPPGTLPYSKVKPLHCNTIGLIGFDVVNKEDALPPSTSHENSNNNWGRRQAENKLADPSAKNTARVKDIDEEPVPLGVTKRQPLEAKKGSNRTNNTVEMEKKIENNAATNAQPTKQRQYHLSGPNEVFVGNVPETTTKEQLRQHFASCGNISSCEIIPNALTKQSSGIARVQYSISLYAKRAADELHGSKLNGNILRVDWNDNGNDEHNKKKGDESPSSIGNIKSSTRSTNEPQQNKNTSILKPVREDTAKSVEDTTATKRAEEYRIGEEQLLKKHGIRNKQHYEKIVQGIHVPTKEQQKKKSATKAHRDEEEGAKKLSPFDKKSRREENVQNIGQVGDTYTNRVGNEKKQSLEKKEEKLQPSTRALKRSGTLDGNHKIDKKDKNDKNESPLSAEEEAETRDDEERFFDVDNVLDGKKKKINKNDNKKHKKDVTATPFGKKNPLYVR